jgi:hypothetical protein
MNRKTAVLALLWCVSCYKGDPGLGTCNADVDCVNLSDGGQLPGAFCNAHKQCEYTCPQICGLTEACIDAQCVSVGPAIASVDAPTTWTLPTQTVTVTAVVDDSRGPGIASAILRIPNKPNVSGTTADTGKVRTYTFAVPGSVQATNSETPVAFTVVATDTSGGTTPDRAAGQGQLRIDGKPPAVSGVTVTNGVAGPDGVPWVKSQPGFVDVFAVIQEGGSGVKVSSLKLMSGGVQFDQPTTTPSPVPNCTFGATTTCHFNVPQDKPGATQVKYDFTVVGTDEAENAFDPGTTSARMGIDGAAPTVGASGGSVQYPANFAGCNGGVVDAAMFCGHDGSHFWRKGEPGTSKVLVVVNDGPDGSGPNNTFGAVTYYFTSATTGCTSTTPCAASSEGGGVFGVLADFSNAPFTSDAGGNGQVSLTVLGKDAVGNVGTSAPVLVNVTRVKWVRSLAGKVISFKASPVVTAVPAPQIIVAGAEGGDAGGVIVSLKPDGFVFWRAGNGDVTTFSNHVAYSSATNILYALGDNANKLFAYQIGSTSASAAYNCPLKIGSTNGQSVGAPAIISSGGLEYALVSDSGLNRLWAFTGSTGSCSFSSSNFNNGGVWTSIANPSTTDGTVIYIPHDGTALSKVAFSNGSFGTVTDASSFTIPIFGPVSIASGLFFGDRNTPAHLHSYSTQFASNWAAGSAAMTDALRAAVVVGATYAFGASNSIDGHLRAFNKSTPTQAWAWGIGPSPGSKVGNVSAPALGVNGVIYFSADANLELVPLTVASDTPSIAPNWISSFQGSSAQAIPSVPTDTRLDSVGTEPAIDDDGVLYFGTLAGKVYALITDSDGPLVPLAGNTWPRVGYDNCNSSNTAFNCQ